MREELLKGSFQRESANFTLYYLQNDWIYILLGSETLNGDDAREIHSWVKDLGGGRRMQVIFDAGEEGLVDHDFRVYIASEESMEQLDRAAVVVTNTAQKLIGNFFMRVNKPSRPVKIFDHLEDAVEWLKK